MANHYLYPSNEKIYGRLHSLVWKNVVMLKTAMLLDTKLNVEGVNEVVALGK